MGGPRGEDPTAGLSEIYIVAADGVADEAAGGRRSGRRSSASGRQSALLAVVSLLAFGIGVGVGTHRGDGTAEGPLGSVAATTAAGQPLTTTAGPAGDSMTRAGETTTRSGAAGTAQMRAPSSAATRQPWPTATDVCGYERPVPLISGTLPLDGATGLTVMAGGAPSRISVDSGDSGEALFPNRVEALAADGQGLVAIAPVEQCPKDSSAGSVLGLRLSNDGELNQIFPSAVSQQGSLQPWGIVSGGNHAYLVATPPYDPDAPVNTSLDVSAEVYTLLATDGSGDSISLPAGFMPMAGWRDLVIGYYLGYPADTYGPIQIYDVASGGIVAQIAAASPQVVAANGHIAWIDDCSTSCIMHRYELDSGRRSDTPVTLSTSEYGGVGSPIAMSPDGRRVAMITYDAAADSRYELGHPGGPARFAMLDLNSGRLTALPGVVRPPKTQAGAAFSPDGRWLAVAVNDGAQTRVLLYDHHLRGPFDPGISVPASSAWTIPIIVEQP